MLDFSTYQERTRATAIYPRGSALEYLTLGLVSEAGEVGGKVKKAIRDEGGVVSGRRLAEVASEMGDTLWYLARLADHLRLDLGAVAQANLDKLADRAERGKIMGDGDAR